MLDNTKLLHGYPVVDPYTGAASIPKYQASTFNQADIFAKQDYSYTRFGNPTVSALEEGIAELENGKYGFAFSSGMIKTEMHCHMIRRLSRNIVISIQ